MFKHFFNLEVILCSVNLFCLLQSTYLFYNVWIVSKAYCVHWIWLHICVYVLMHPRRNLSLATSWTQISWLGGGERGWRTSIAAEQQRWALIFSSAGTTTAWIGVVRLCVFVFGCVHSREVVFVGWEKWEFRIELFRFCVYPGRMLTAWSVSDSISGGWFLWSDG